MAQRAPRGTPVAPGVGSCGRLAIAVGEASGIVDPVEVTKDGAGEGPKPEVVEMPPFLGSPWELQAANIPVATRQQDRINELCLVQVPSL